MPRGEWTAFHVDAVRRLEPGLSEIPVHDDHVVVVRWKDLQRLGGGA